MLEEMFEKTALNHMESISWGLFLCKNFDLNRLDCSLRVKTMIVNESEG